MEGVRLAKLNTNRAFLSLVQQYSHQILSELSLQVYFDFSFFSFSCHVLNSANMKSALGLPNVEFMDLTGESELDEKATPCEAASVNTENASGLCKVEFVDLTGKFEVDENTMPGEPASAHDSILPCPARPVCWPVADEKGSQH